jgi:hypothetical protein
MNALRTTAIVGTILCLAIILVVHQSEAGEPFIVRYIPPIELEYEECYSVDLENFRGGPVFEDPDDDDLTYGYITNGDILVSVNGSVVTFIPKPGLSGCVSDVMLYAKDPYGNRSEKMYLYFDILNDERIPYVSDYEPQPTRISIPEGEAINFRVIQVENIETDDWSIRWSVSGLRGLVLGSEEFIFPYLSEQDVIFNSSGKYSVRADVREGGWEIDCTSIAWWVTVLDVNWPPEITYLTGDQVLTHGDDVHLQVVAHDPDLDNLSYRWYHSRDFVHVEEIGTYTKVVCSNGLGPGRHQFLCEVSDGDSIVVSRWVNVTIVERDPQRPPSPWCAVLPAVMAIPAVLAIRRTSRRGCS